MHVCILHRPAPAHEGLLQALKAEEDAKKKAELEVALEATGSGSAPKPAVRASRELRSGAAQATAIAQRDVPDDSIPSAQRLVRWTEFSESVIFVHLVD